VETRNIKRRNDGSEHGKCLKILRKQKYDIDMKTTTEQHTRITNQGSNTLAPKKKRKHTHALIGHIRNNRFPSLLLFLHFSYEPGPDRNILHSTADRASREIDYTWLAGAEVLARQQHHTSTTRVANHTSTISPG